VTARMKHKTELRKGLVQVGLSAAVPVGTPVTAGGKDVGWVYTQSGGLGLAHLRFDRASGPMQAGAAEVTVTKFDFTESS
jgi:folate-binding Fe-S cluster repair protein YgfZ